MNGNYDCLFDGVPATLPGGGSVDIGFYATRLSNQNFGVGAEVLLDFTTKMDENPVGVFNLATDQFTAPQDGRYVFTSAIEATLAAAGSAFLRFYLNGVYNGSSSDQVDRAATVTPNFSIVTWMLAGETAEMRAFQNTGFAATLVGCCNQLWFSGAAIFV